MKKVKVIASLVLAAALGTTVFAAACDNGKEKSFKLEDYAHSLNSAFAEEHLKDYSEEHVKDAFTSVVKKSFVNLTPLGNGFADATVETKATTTAAAKTTHTFYDVKNYKELYTGLKGISPVGITYSDSSSSSQEEVFNYYILIGEKTTQSGSQSTTSDTYKYVAPDGQIIPMQGDPAPTEISLSIINKYDDEDDNTLYFVKLAYTYTTGSGTTSKVNSVEKFYCYYVDEDEEIHWNSVDEDATETPVDSDYKTGAQLGLEKVNLVEALSDCEEFPESNYDGIEFTCDSVGKYATYTFYKDGEKLSSVAVEGEACFVGNYLYYYDVQPVSSEATEGYNYVKESKSLLGETFETKENWTLYRYDFVNGAKEAEAVECDYIVTDVHGTLYNYTEKVFDKLAVTAHRKVNGVVYENDSTKDYVLVLDDRFGVSADLTATNLRGTEVYKLKDDRYLAGNYILDGELNTIVKLNSASVWSEKNVIATTIYDQNNGYKTLFIDYDGKVVIEPSNVTTFYGDKAYSNGKVYSQSQPAGIKPEKLVEANRENGETVYVVDGVIFMVTSIKRTATAGPSQYYTVTIYDLSGEMLYTVNGVKDFDTPANIGGKVVVKASVYADLTKNDSETCYYVIG